MATTTTEALVNLIQLFSRVGSNEETKHLAVSKPIPVSKLPKPLNGDVAKCLKAMAITDNENFLYAIFDKTKAFKEFGTPEISLVSGELAVILGCVDVYPITFNLEDCNILETVKNINNTNYYSYKMQLPGCSNRLALRLWTDPEVQLDTDKLKEKEYLIDNLREYVFDSRKVLKPGEYTIEKCLKPGKNVLLQIDGCLYYGQEKFIEELKTAKEQVLVIEERETNKGQKYIVSYIAGFPPKSPSQKIKDFIASLGIEVNKENYEAKKFCKFDPQIEFTISGIENSEYVWENKTIKQKLVSGTVGDKKYTIQANSPIVNAINDGRLTPKDNENYESGEFKIIFLGVQLGSKGAEYKVTFESPINESSKESMLSLLQ